MDCNFASLIIRSPCFLFLLYLFVNVRLVKLVAARLMVRRIDAPLYWRVCIVWRRLITLIVCSDRRRESTVVMQWFSARQIETLIGLENMTLNGPLGNASILPVAIIHASVPPHCSSASIRTTSFVSVATSKRFSDHTVTLFCLARNTRCRTCSLFFYHDALCLVIPIRGFSSV